MADLSERAREHICGLNDEQLVTYIVVGIDAYEPEAVDFAREEFQRRQLDPSLVAKLTQEAVEQVRSNNTARAEAAQRPLGFFEIVSAFCAGCTVIGILSLARRDMQFLVAGEDRKSAQMWKSAVAGIVAIVVAIIIVICFNI